MRSPKDLYPSQVLTGDPGFPYGKARNQLVLNDGTGFPFEQQWVNDHLGAFQAVLTAAGITPDGTEEKVAEIPAGNYFGELAPMFGLQRSASARAQGATVVTGLGLREFREQFHVADTKVLSEAAD